MATLPETSEGSTSEWLCLTGRSNERAWLSSETSRSSEGWPAKPIWRRDNHCLAALGQWTLKRANLAGCCRALQSDAIGTVRRTQPFDQGLSSLVVKFLERRR